MTAQFQIRQQLGCMDWEETFYRFVFNYDKSFDEHVDAVANLNTMPSVVNWEGHLCIDPEVRPPKLHRKARLVGGFEQTRTQ